MILWPNWVDLLIVIVVFRACYVGAARGVAAEALSLIMAIGVTGMTLRYSSDVTTALSSGLPKLPGLASYLPLAVFWGLFVILLFCGRMVVEWLMRWLKGERIHWLTHSLGLFLGGARGLWWSGFLLLVLMSSGIAYLQESVETRSVLGPRFLRLSHSAVERVLSQFPGTQNSSTLLIPPIIQKSS